MSNVNIPNLIDIKTCRLRGGGHVSDGTFKGGIHIIGGEMPQIGGEKVKNRVKKGEI